MIFPVATRSKILPLLGSAYISDVTRQELSRGDAIHNGRDIASDINESETHFSS
jgi:hypothetical protein